MKKLEYKLQFNTPAFMLVSDSTKAQWRTPPIKTMLRFWWRILRAESLGYNTDLLRQEEARLFGCVSGEQSRASEIRIRLLPVDPIGEKTAWMGTRETPIKSGVGDKNDLLFYSGFGLINRQKSDASCAAALSPGKPVRLILLVPDAHEQVIKDTLNLAHRFATLGGRHANGWGSLDIAGAEDIVPPQLELERALDLDWPAALGIDKGQPLRWELKESFKDWKNILRAFANIRKESINGAVNKRQRVYLSGRSTITITAFPHR